MKYYVYQKEKTTGKEKQELEKMIQEHRKQQAEKRKLELEEWRKKHPGFNDYYFDIPEDQWDDYITPEESERLHLDEKQKSIMNSNIVCLV